MYWRNLLIISLLFTVFTGFMPSKQEVSDRIARFIEAGNAKGLSTYFAESVDIKIDDNQSVYSKAQATIVMQNFFKKNPPQNFTLMHHGKSQRGLEFRIGRLKTKTTDFRISFHLKSNGNSFLIHQFYIEKA